jgi:ribosomal protein L44E
LPNRRLTEQELDNLALLLTNVRQRLRELAGGDDALFWALRRKLWKELVYDERSKPAQRRALKTKKRVEQANKCASCHEILPEMYAVLDRFDAMKGYTAENTRLLCPGCDARIQQERGFK